MTVAFEPDFVVDVTVSSARLEALLAGRERADAGLSRALAVVRAPATALTLRAWGGEAASVETTMLFADTIATGGGVVVHSVPGGKRLSAFVEAEAPLAFIGALLPPPIEPVPLALQLPALDMAVLAAMLDMAAAERAAAAIARTTGAPVAASRAVTPARLAVALDGWWLVSRLDQVLTPVVSLGGRLSPPDEVDLAAALARLVRLGVIVGGDVSGFRPTALLEGLIAALPGLSAGVQWQRLARLDAGHVVASERIWLLGGGGVVLELAKTGPDLLRLRLVGSNAVRDFIAGECLAVPGAVVATVSSGEARGSGPAAVAAPVSTPERRAGPKFCGACGAALAPGAKFCGGCGAVVRRAG